MFYTGDPKEAGLPHNPLKAIIAPRPIAWVATRSADGFDNLAPYSFFNGVSEDPPMIGFACGPKKLGIDEAKDSGANILETREFCVSIVSTALKDAMNITSAHYPHGEDEFAHAGLTKGQSRIVKPPFVAESPVSMECKLYSETELPGGYRWIMGTVVGIHIRDEYLVDGLLDVSKYQPLARLGYRDYTSVTDVFSLDRPEQTET